MALAFCRFTVAAILLASSVGKLLDLRGFAGVIATYQVLPEWAQLPAGAALTLFELGLSVFLFWGKDLRKGGLLATGLHVVFLVWAGAALARGLDIPNCGCFGVFLARPLTYQTLVEDLVMLALSVGIWRLAKR